MEREWGRNIRLAGCAVGKVCAAFPALSAENSSRDEQVCAKFTGGAQGAAAAHRAATLSAPSLSSPHALPAASFLNGLPFPCTKPGLWTDVQTLRLS